LTAFTSAGTGDWDADATWTQSGQPGADDTVNIVSGHTVTYDTAVSAGNGFGDIDIDGILVHSAVMNVNGKMTIDGGGCLHQKPGSKILFYGTVNTLYHGVFFENETDAAHIAEGTDGMPCTTLTSALAIGATTIPVADASKLAAGEWISIFNNTSTATGEYEFVRYEDEGMWIHDISSNDVFFRWFVGPDDVTISSVEGASAMVVSNSKVYRQGQSIIFGTGTNRNVCRIAAINHATNTLSLKNLADENAYTIDNSPTVVGEYVYVTGCHKPHGSGDRVRKIATVTTVARVATDTTITVAQDEKFEAGDILVIECVLQTPGSTSNRDWNAYQVMHEVVSRSSNTLTLDAQIGYTVPVGALVTRLTRDIVIGSQNSGADDIVDSSNMSYYYGEHTSSNYSRKLVLKDVWFKNIGNTKQNAYAGVAIRGYYSTNSLPVTLLGTTKVQSCANEGWIEGCTVQVNGTGRRDYSGMWCWDYRNSCVRACVTARGRDAFTTHWDPSQRIYNCFGISNSHRGLRVQGSNYNHEEAYCYLNRVGTRGIYLEPTYMPGRGCHNIIMNVVDNDPIRVNRHTGYTGSMWAIDVKDALYQGPYMSEVGHGDFACLYSRFRGIEDSAGKVRVSGSSYAGRQGYSSGNAIFRVIEADFEFDKVVNYTYYMRFEWDKAEQAYFVQRSFHDDGETAALREVFLIPANATARIRISCKGTSNWSGTEPHAYVSTSHNILGGYTGADSGEPFGSTSATEWVSMQTQGSTSQQFSGTNFESAYQSIDHVVPAVPFSRYVEAGVMAIDTDMANVDSEGFYLKPIDIRIDLPYAHRDMLLQNSSETTDRVHLGTVHGEVTRRWGGLR